jgi:GT2 family glycosyltransferase
MTEECLKISVVVVAFNEERNIRACLDSLTLLDYPVDRLEILVVDNGSEDRTREIVREYARVRLIANPVRGIGASRNVGLREARRELLAFTDADCTVPPDWLSKLERAFREARREDPKVVAAGGSNAAPDDANRFRQAIAVAVQNFWGNHGSVQGLIIKDRMYVDHLPTLNVLYDRKRVVDEGGFDEKMGNISEDVELSYRLRWQGYKLLYVPDAAVRHVWRTDYRSWSRNMLVYGKGRSWLMKKDRRFFRVMNIAPVGLLLCALASPLVTFAPLYWIPVAHAALTALVSVGACAKARRLDLLGTVFAIYLVTHYSYGVGEVVGLLETRGRIEA